jgi:hypothetical protein
LIHGRPFPLKGNYFANIFNHFRPTGKLLQERETPVLTDAGDDEMPIWILRGSPEERKWMWEHGKKIVESPAAAPLDEVPQAAQTGNLRQEAFVTQERCERMATHPQSLPRRA